MQQETKNVAETDANGLNARRPVVKAAHRHHAWHGPTASSTMASNTAGSYETKIIVTPQQQTDFTEAAAFLLITYSTRLHPHNAPAPHQKTLKTCDDMKIQILVLADNSSTLPPAPKTR